MDAGIFPSHIGFESAVTKDCWTLTRSILADNSPYFESGARITYTTNNNKLILSGLVLNGWQRITRVDGNSLISFGSQLQYKPNLKTVINYSTFIGSDKPDSTRLMRYFNNLYAIHTLSDKFGITAGFDIGTEQKIKGSNNMNFWYSPVIILKHIFHSKWAIAGRGEYYHDKSGIIISTGTLNGFQTFGYSFNVDYSTDKAVIRFEARSLKSKDEIFTKGSGHTDNNSFISTSVCVSF